MYICMVRTFSRIWINRAWLPILLAVGRTIFFPAPVRAREFGLARRARQSRPASARSFPILRLNHQSSIINLVLTYAGVPPAFRDGAHLYHQTPSDQSRVYRVTQLGTDGVYCRESAGTGPVVLKIVPVTCAAFSGFTINRFFIRLSFPTSTINTINTIGTIGTTVCSGHDDMSCDTESIGG